MCCAARLARFNTMLDEKQPDYWTHFFMGVPAPAGAGLAMLPIILWKATDWEGFRNPVFVGFFLCLSGALMASRIPTLCLKHLHIPKKYSMILLPISLFFMAGVFGAPWITLSLLGIGYILMIPVCVYYFLKFKKEAL